MADQAVGSNGKVGMRAVRTLARRKASWWKRNFEAAESEITDVISKTPWHGLSNHVEFVYRGRSYSIGDMISHDEAHEITHVLGGALGLRQHS